MQSRRFVRFNAFERFENSHQSQCNGAFEVITPSGPKIVFPGRYVNELKNIEELSFTGFMKNDFIPYFKGFESIRISVESTVIKDMVRTRLT
jgi:hypothetical protein